jgi:REP-associated tyrosine transposase
MITYRLADSLPKERLDQFRQELKCVNSNLIEKERRNKIEKWLDTGYGNCILRNKENAKTVVETWQRFDRERYDLISWVVMPNHVHVLINVYEGFQLGKIVLSWKNFTARKINEREGNNEESRTGVRCSRTENRVW